MKKPKQSAEMQIIQTSKPNPERADQIVINWHLTEACNFGCQYCYAHWEKGSGSRELIHDPARSKALVQSLYDFFRPENENNPLKREMQWGSVRLNIAGGEPLMYLEKTADIIRFASDIGFDVSIITNGSYFTDELLADIGPRLTMIGVSLDSARDDVNRGIGRIDKRQNLLDINRLSGQLRNAKAINADLRLKVNTVVNALNFEDDMSSIIEQIAPDKWKVLRMLPVVNNHLEVTDAQFQQFVDQHSRFLNVMQVEDNDSLTESYIMVDPRGQFFQNGNGTGPNGYDYSHPILTTGVEEAFGELPFTAQKFLERYKSPAKASKLLRQDGPQCLVDSAKTRSVTLKNRCTAQQ